MAPIQKIDMPRSRDGNRINALDDRVKTLEKNLKGQSSLFQDLQERIRTNGEAQEKDKDSLDNYF